MPFYDPEVEFLDLAVLQNDVEATSKISGPDLNGRYGGLGGVGGLEAVVTDLGELQPVLSDARGNVLAAVTNGVVAWSSSRPTGYGAVPAFRPPAMETGAGLAQAIAWR